VRMVPWFRAIFWTIYAQEKPNERFREVGFVRHGTDSLRRTISGEGSPIKQELHSFSQNARSAQQQDPL
jgi:hypothetical protein